ncbi:MAG: M60 family metallopeptidase [Bacteroidaceae bacterium]|nr:M60 family metallopeptidase [Bacteroidaceae bacterium]
MKIRSLFSVLFLSLSVLANAGTIESGSVYRIINAAYNRAVAEDYVASKVTTTQDVGSTADDWEQLWVVTKSATGKYSLRNVYTGRYISSSVNMSQQMTMTTSANTLTIATATYDADGFTISGSMSVHCAQSQSYWLVGWSTPEAAANTFYFKKVEGVDVETARANYNELSNVVKNSSVYNSKLKTFFADNACTELNADYATCSDEELRDALAESGLPDVLQNMAVKVKNESWAECEKMFRVHDFQISSESTSWTAWTRQDCQSHMKNPTGITADARQILYVMVDDDIPAGATLYLAYASGVDMVNGTTSGTQLKKGLNIVPVAQNSSSFFVMYNTNTYNNGSWVALSDFHDIKIHFEGGHVDGYYEKNAGADVFNWIMKNHKHVAIQLKGTYCLIQMNYEDFQAGAKVDEIDSGIDAWDWVCKWEWSLSGLLWDKDDAVTGEYISSEGVGRIPYPEYYNNHHLAWSPDNSSYMNASSWRTYYARYTMVDMISKNKLFYGGTCSSWGPAHEIGHTNQGVFNMPGGTEVTNNLFANAVNFMVGYSDSRGNTNIDVSNYFQNRTPWYNFDIWAQTRMYYHLFLYYHAAKNDITFYPRLFAALRSDGLRFGSANSKSNPTLGQNMHLKFYEKCCETAKEDLTDFFEAYGFFIPMDLLYVGDYSNHYVTSTQAAIDAAIARVKAKNYPKNTSVIFIDDRSKNVPVSGLYKAEGHTGIKRDHDENPTASLGYTTGSYTEYEGEGTTPSGYTLTQSGSKLTFKGGTGAVGFIAYDTDGHVLGFSNASSFSLPSDYDGRDVTIYAVGSKQAMQEITGFDPDAATTSVLKKTVTSAKALLKLEDIDGTHPGFYISEELTTLKSLVEEAEQAIADKEISKYGDVNERLRAETERLESTPSSRTQIVPGAYYRFRNFSYTKRYMYYNNGMVATKESTSKTDNKQWWRMSNASNGAYYISNYNGKYINTISTSTQATAKGDDESSALEFNFNDKGNGTFCIITPEGNQTGLHSAANANYNVVGWSDTPATNWYLEEVLSAESASLLDAVTNLITKSELLISSADDCDEKTALQEAVASAKKLNKPTTDASELKAVLDSLRTAYSALWSKVYPGSVDFDAYDENQYFRLRNVDAGLYLDLKNGKVSIQAKNESSKTQPVRFIPSEQANLYYICSENGYYMVLGTANTWDMEATKTLQDNTRSRFRISNLGDGKYSLSCLYHIFKFVGLDATSSGSYLYPDKDKTKHTEWVLELAGTTDIEEVKVETATARQDVFDLSGRRYDSATGLRSGIYIINGRKRFVR